MLAQIAGGAGQHQVLVPVPAATSQFAVKVFDVLLRGMTKLARVEAVGAVRLEILQQEWQRLLAIRRLGQKASGTGPTFDYETPAKSGNPFGLIFFRLIKTKPYYCLVFINFRPNGLGLYYYQYPGQQ